MKMNNLKKICAAITAVLVLASAAYSMEWGGVFKNETEFDANNFVTKDPLGKIFSQSDAVYLWLNTPLNKKSTIYLSAEGMYKFKFATDFADVKDVNNILDIDLLKFVGDVYIGPGVLSINGGRFPISDITGVIFNQTSDGLSVKYTLQACEISTYAGFTRLLNANTVTMLGSDGFIELPVSKVYSLSHSYVPLSASVSFPALFGNQSMTIQALSFIDGGADKQTRSYGTFVLQGPVTDIFSYEFSTTFGTTNFKSAMNYTAVNLSIYPTNFMLIQTGIEYASGNNGKLSSFTGISSRTAYASAFSPETSGVIIPKVVFGFTGANYQLGVTGRFVLGCPEAKVAAKGIDANVSFLYNIFTDLQLGFNTGIYIPVDENKNEANGSATLSVSFSF